MTRDVKTRSRKEREAARISKRNYAALGWKRLSTRGSFGALIGRSLKLYEMRL
jgi:hypothetical protein